MIGLAWLANHFPRLRGWLFGTSHFIVLVLYDRDGDSKQKPEMSPLLRHELQEMFRGRVRSS